MIILLASCQEPYHDVIKYFEKQNNPEKLEAAMYLIKNLKYQKSFEGEQYNNMLGVYSYVSKLPVMERADTFNMKNHSSIFFLKKDYKTITSEFLIKHVTYCYDIWNKTFWKDKYDFNYFCEYVLPYKSRYEPASLWIQDYNKVWSRYLNDITFYGGDIYKATNYKKKSHEILSLNDFDISDLVTIHQTSEPLTIDNVYSYENSSFYMKILYTCGKKYPKLKVSINNEDTVTIDFHPTHTKYTYPSKPFVAKINLKKGYNILNFISLNDTIHLDNIEIVNYERFYRDDPFYNLIDGASYKIKNCHTNNYLEIHENSKEDFAKVITTDYNNFDNQKFYLQNIDYGFFKISPTHVAKDKKVLEVLGYSRKENASIVQCFFHGEANQQWAIIPVSQNRYKILNRFNSKCLQADINGKVSQGTYKDLSKQHWIFEKTNDSIFLDSTSHVVQDSPVEIASRIFHSIDFEWFLPASYLPDLPADTLFKYKTGLCSHESQYFLYILRSLGIPACIDFNPQRPNASAGHSWNSIIDDKGNTLMSQINVGPNKNVVELPISKIYRIGFSINQNSLFFKKNKHEKIPPFFLNPYLFDVTNAYCNTLNLEVSLFGSMDKKKRPYLAIFDNKKWFPVAWGNKNKSHVLFNNMGLGILYLPVYNSQQGIEAAGYPFIVHNDSTIKRIVPSVNETIKLVLYRKYPIRPVHEWALTRMDGGRFEGANKSDFSDATLLYKHQGISNPVFHTVLSESDKKFKYVRYIGADGSFSTISEIMFYDENGIELRGKIIGSDGSYKDFGSTKEKAFDKNILTGFDGHTSKGTWVGIEFSKPVAIKKIRYIPRNDGNCIEIGNRYELVFWNNKTWESLGEKVADSDSLVYPNCPKNALFLLHNKTKGIEERPFLLNENGEIDWW